MAEPLRLLEGTIPEEPEKSSIKERLLGRTPSVVGEEEKKGSLGRMFERVGEVKGIREDRTSVSPGIIKVGEPTSKLNFHNPLPTPEPVQVATEHKAVMTPGNPSDGFTNVVDFLFGDEMAVVGLKLDAEGFHADWDIAKQQWSEEPLWLNALSLASGVGSIVFPAVKAAHVSTKFGKIGGLLGKFGDEATEMKKFHDLGWVDSATTKLKEADKRKLRQLEWNKSRYSSLKDKMDRADRGEDLNIGPFERMKFEFDKRFTNNYFEITGSMVNGSDVRENFYKNVNDLFEAEDLGRFFIDVPEAAAGKKIMGHWMHKLDPNQFGKVKLTQAEQRWADGMETAMRAHQDEALKTGLITQETYDKIGAFHIPSLKKGTGPPDVGTERFLIPVRGRADQAGKVVGKVPGGPGKKEYVALSQMEMPRLTSDTMKTRKADLPEVYQRIVSGDWITDPTEITTRGLVMDRLLLNNFSFIRDLAMDSRYATKGKDLIAKYGSVEKAKKAGFVALDSLDSSIQEPLRRMMKTAGAQLGPMDELPYIHKGVFDDLFGETGMFAQTQGAVNILDLLTAIHKTSKTALNIPTHFQNLTGNIAMLMQAGFNPLTRGNLNLMGKTAKAFSKVADHISESKKLGRGAQAAKDFGVIEHNGKKFDVAKEFLQDKQVMELIEESAFDNVEGFNAIEEMARNLGKDQTVMRGLVGTLMKTKNMAQVGDRVKWMDKMTKWYLGEDMVPKMAYYMDLRSKGFSKQAAILEVGRRLPMYKTVGSAVRGARRFVFPWATFPAEALRITKNNMMDNPLKMMPWLQMPGLVQGMLSLSGGGPASREEAKEIKAQLPFWAQRTETVVGDPQTLATAGGAGSGAVIGGTVGARFGGAAGAALGGLAGGAIAGAAANLLTDEQGEQRMRGAVLDFLPHTSFMLSNTSPDFGTDTLPWKDFQGMLEQVPAEPFSILRPLIEVVSGKNSFGQDIGAEGFGDQMGKVFAGTLGWLAPPFIQKYGLRTNTPDISVSEGLLGHHLPGDVTNMSRLLTDMGATVDPTSGHPGNLTHDFLLKNFGGMKSWVADPNIQLANEGKTESHLAETRTYLSKNLSFFLENGDDQKAGEILTSVESTFVRQYADNPGRAQEEFRKWLERRIKQIGRHPRLRNWNEDELVERLNQASNFAGEARTQARAEMQKALQNQLLIRGAAKRERYFQSPKHKTPGLGR